MVNLLSVEINLANQGNADVIDTYTLLIPFELTREGREYVTVNPNGTI